MFDVEVLGERMSNRRRCSNFGGQLGWGSACFMASYELRVMFQGYLSHFFQGSFFSGNHPNPRGNGWFLKRTMVEKNGESTPRHAGPVLLGGPQPSPEVLAF